MRQEQLPGPGLRQGEARRRWCGCTSRVESRRTGTRRRRIAPSASRATPSRSALRDRDLPESGVRRRLCTGTRPAPPSPAPLPRRRMRQSDLRRQSVEHLTRPPTRIVPRVSRCRFRSPINEHARTSPHFLDGIVHQPDGGAVTRQMPIAVFSEADVRRLEAMWLLDACGTLHQEGILEDHEYEAKRL